MPTYVIAELDAGVRPVGPVFAPSEAISLGKLPVAQNIPYTPNVAGVGYLAGVTKENGTLLPNCLVRLYDRVTGQPVASATSNGSGAVFFDNVDPNRVEQFFAVAFDIAGGVQYNAIVYDLLTPKPYNQTVGQFNGTPFNPLCAFGTNYYVTGDPYGLMTELILNFNGTNGSTTFTDESYSPKTVTPNAVTVSTAQSKFGGASGSFNGTTGYLTTSPIFSLGSNDLCFEAFVRLTAMPTSDAWPTNFAQHMEVVGVGTPSVSDGCALIIGQNNLIMHKQDVQVAAGAHGMTTGVWYHVAGVRYGDVWVVFVDGVMKGAGNSAGAITDGSGVYIGCETNQGAFFNGFMDALRVTKGVARYIPQFTVPSSAFTSDANTATLLHMDGANNSTTFTDSSGNALTYTPVSGAKISTAQSVFGGAAALFNGTSDYVTTPHNTALNLAGSDCTLECWIYPTTTGNYRTLLSKRQNDTANEWQLYLLQTDNRFGFFNGTQYLSTQPVVLNAWNHVAITLKGTNLKLWLNGKLVGAYTGVTITDNTTAFTIGAVKFTASTFYEFFGGYIDEVRVTKGLARYDYSFTPPNADLHI